VTIRDIPFRRSVTAMIARRVKFQLEISLDLIQQLDLMDFFRQIPDDPDFGINSASQDQIENIKQSRIVKESSNQIAVVLSGSSMKCVS
jgi:hypothetical protein